MKSIWIQPYKGTFPFSSQMDGWADTQHSTGLGKLLMGYLEIIGSKIPDVTKVMLTVFGCNEKGVRFYQKLGYTKDEFSPPPKILRNGAKIENDYLILSRAISR
jgi:N-alpha-acetyltransferase 40